MENKRWKIKDGKMGQFLENEFLDLKRESLSDIEPFMCKVELPWLNVLEGVLFDDE